MTADKIIDDTIIPIAESGFSDALEILQLIALLKAQNSNNVNKGLNKIGAGRAAMAARNAFIAQLTLLVIRCYAEPRTGDLHIRKAFDLIDKDPRISVELGNRGLAAKLKDAQAIWLLCRGDNRLERIRHFRNKTTAHIAELDTDIPLPQYDELFSFANETTKAMQALANASGANNHNLPDWNDELTGTAKAFWKPWESETPQ